MSNQAIQINLSIAPAWTMIKDVRERIEEAMNEENYPPELIDAGVMCASELVENAIKFAPARAGAGHIKFVFSIDEDQIAINVSNGIKDENDLRNVKEHIDMLNKGGDPSRLYLKRLKELMKTLAPRETRLGLYRIAHEGEFKLDYRFQDELLTVTAERMIR
jgi:anti-sigma regulatory factor (Ser/Thr protein kinase)